MIRLSARVGASVLALALSAACSGGTDDDDNTTIDRDAGVAERDAGAPRDGGPVDPCGPFAHEDSAGTCTSSVAWTNGPPIPGARDHHATTIYHFGDTPYLVVSGGGRHSFEEFYNDIHRIELSDDGRPIGAWEQIGTLQSRLAGHTMQIRDGRIYVLGGATMEGRYPYVYSAWITNEGEIGSWRPEPEMPTGVWHHQSFFHDDYIYVVGGQWGNERASNEVHRAAIVDDHLEDWESLEPLPAVRSHHGTVATDDGIYVLGGLEDSDFRAQIMLGRFDAEGRVTAWEDLGAIPGDGLVTPSVGLFDGRIWVVAGLTGSLEFVGTVLSAEILADGTVGPLVETPTPIPEGRGHVHQLPALNGRMFLVGGRSGLNLLGRFQSYDSFWVGTVR
ncbi:MAG: hypothetical protein RMA76_37830 [Deltaproteobacteria bacterium]|jgi:hypothetical protein